jgi:hypothetical protein
MSILHDTNSSKFKSFCWMFCSEKQKKKRSLAF